MHKPNDSKSLANAICKVVQQVQCNKLSQQLELDCRTLASTIVHALTLHSINDVSAWVHWRMDTSIKPSRRTINKLNPESLEAQMRDVINVNKISKKKKSQKSKLDPFRAEIIHFNNNGFSLSEIRDWLRRYGRIQANRSTIFRKIEEWNKHGKT